jgi:hypothetical protein
MKMRQNRFRTRVAAPITAWMIVLLSSGGTSTTATAQQAASSEHENQDSSGFVVLQLSLDIGVRDADPTPRVRIYGDRRVAVYFPTYAPKAGHYELTLGDGEFPRLADAIDSVLTFDSDSTADAIQRMEAQAHAAALRENRPIVVSDWSDETATILEAAIPVVIPDTSQALGPAYQNTGAALDPGGATVEGVQSRSVVWTGLQNQAERFPSIEQLQRLAAVERWLVALATDERLVAVKQTR